jgi:purine-binding chemotaxis protein CheW
MQQGSSQSDDQFLILGIEREAFAVPVETVIEILDMREMFRVPDAPSYLGGLIDVRGRSVPVIDLRLKLGLPALAPTETTRIMVLNVPIDGKQLVIGLVADRVYEVAPLDKGSLEPPPEIGVRWHSDYIHGVGRRGESFVLVFDLPRLFASMDYAFLGGVRGHPPTKQDVAA